MAKFIELTQRASGEPICINPNAIQSLKPGRNDGTHIQFMSGGDQLYVVVEETYDDVVSKLSGD